MVPLYKQAWLKNDRGCISPDTLVLPVGSGVRVIRDGIELAGALWRPQVGYIAPDNLSALQDASDHMDGFDMHSGAPYPSDTPRVDSVWPGGNQTLRMYAPEMIEVYCTIRDLRKAVEAMKKNPVITVCPVCDDYERYATDETYRKVYDTCSMYFLRFWYYGAI